MKNIVFFVLLTITCGLSCMEAGTMPNNIVKVSVQYGSKSAKRTIDVDLETITNNPDNQLPLFYNQLKNQLKIDHIDTVMFKGKPVNNDNILDILLNSSTKPSFIIQKPSYLTLEGYPEAGSQEESEMVRAAAEQVKNDHKVAQETHDEEFARTLQDNLPREKNDFSSFTHFLSTYKKKILFGTTLFGLLGYWWYRYSKD